MSDNGWTNRARCTTSTPDNVAAMEQQIKKHPDQAHALTETALSCWGKEAMNSMFKHMNEQNPNYRLTYDSAKNVTAVDFGQTNIYGPYTHDTR